MQVIQLARLVASQEKVTITLFFLGNRPKHPLRIFEQLINLLSPTGMNRIAILARLPAARTGKAAHRSNPAFHFHPAVNGGCIHEMELRMRFSQTTVSRAKL
ncbi:hypothetical protein [Nitrosomonas sp. HPC101]|uniref:hypothetical protein n=1 Tax=Nitrosomonas sp. HPC101 TaxID=1658667 RepID=UPI00136E8300|nr:hypothetical protein [Nitrosomonas sp. HPC101]